MKNVTLRQLRVFVAVGKHLSFARAAEDLALTGPAVSMQIKDLEDQVGVPLFERSTRSVSLTTVGEYVLAHARRVLSVLRDAEDMVANLRGLQGGVLDLATVGTAIYFLPKVLALFREEHPQVRVRLRVARNGAEMARMLREGDTELAVMGRPSTEWATRAEPFALNPLVLVTAADHPFTRVDAVAPELLAREAFVVREEGSGTRAALDEYMRAHHLSATTVMEVSSDEAVKQAVMAGLGVGLLSIHTIALELSLGLLATPDIKGLPVMRRWHVVNKLGKVLSPAAEAFRYFLLERGEALLARALQPCHVTGSDMPACSPGDRDG